MCRGVPRALILPREWLGVIAVRGHSVVWMPYGFQVCVDRAMLAWLMERWFYSHLNQLSRARHVFLWPRRFHSRISSPYSPLARSRGE